MATGRTTIQHTRLYMNAVDMSSYLRNIGPLAQTFGEAVDDAVTLPVKKTWPTQVTMTPGTANMIFDGITIHNFVNSLIGTSVNLIVARGIQGAPAIGCPVFCGQFTELEYATSDSSGIVAATVPFGSVNGATVLQYATPWGTLLHPSGAETAVNTADGFLDASASTSKGGYMIYQINTASGSGNINATIKVQDGATAGATTNDLVTSGVLNLGSGGTFNNMACALVPLATNATVNKYLRWQVVFGTGGNACTSITFVMAFVRNYI